MSKQSPAKHDNGNVIASVNWNEIPDEKDLQVWDRLTSNFWLPDAVPVSNDIPSWATLTKPERESTMRVFTGLTMLDTIQGTVGAVSLIPHAETMHEEAVYTNIASMESIHAKSYSQIFMTLASTPEINEAFRWSEENECLQFKGREILRLYKNGGPQEQRIASVLLESFLFYSGFYLPIRWSAHGKLTNTADIIRLIIRDEAVHGYYIGYKYQRAMRHETEERKSYLRGLTEKLLRDLYDNEIEYTEQIYDQLGWTEDVKRFLRYNANKAMNNLGYEGLFKESETRVSAEVMASMNPGGDENHDFFSGAGSTYVIGTAEATTDDDWDF